MIDQVRTIIIEYLAGRFPVEDLYSRLPDPWELDETDADDAARETAMCVIGYLAEMERGDRTENELRTALNAVLAEPEAIVASIKGPVDAWANQPAGTGLQVALG